MSRKDPYEVAKGEELSGPEALGGQSSDELGSTSRHRPDLPPQLQDTFSIAVVPSPLLSTPPSLSQDLPADHQPGLPSSPTMSPQNTNPLGSDRLNDLPQSEEVPRLAASPYLSPGVPGMFKKPHSAPVPHPSQASSNPLEPLHAQGSPEFPANSRPLFDDGHTPEPRKAWQTPWDVPPPQSPAGFQKTSMGAPPPGSTPQKKSAFKPSRWAYPPYQFQTPPSHPYASPATYGQPASRPLPDPPKDTKVDIEASAPSKKKVAFVANDPFHNQSIVKPSSDKLTFDEIPLPTSSPTSVPWMYQTTPPHPAKNTASNTFTSAPWQSNPTPKQSPAVWGYPNPIPSPPNWGYSYGTPYIPPASLVYPSQPVGSPWSSNQTNMQPANYWGYPYGLPFTTIDGHNSPPRVIPAAPPSPDQPIPFVPPPLDSATLSPQTPYPNQPGRMNTPTLVLPNQGMLEGNPAVTNNTPIPVIHRPDASQVPRPHMSTNGQPPIPYGPPQIPYIPLSTTPQVDPTYPAHVHYSPLPHHHVPSPIYTSDGYPSRKPSAWSRLCSLLRLPFQRKAKFDDILKPSLEQGSGIVAVNFVLSTLPSQIYLHVLLRLPSLYFSRVARIFEEADLTLPEIKKMALETASEGKGHDFDFHAFESRNMTPQYEKLKSTWESFIDSVMREWKTFNIISVLLLSAILTILQIDAAAADPVTRYAALFSLICALMSLLFGCMYIIRFGSMRKTYKAAEWALEAKRTKTVIWWNVWVLLAMPAIWLTWSIILYIACIMSFVWRVGLPDAAPLPPPVSPLWLLPIRISITAVLGLGVTYGCLIILTFRRYGDAMDRAWKRRIDGWVREKASNQQSTPGSQQFMSNFNPQQTPPWGWGTYGGNPNNWPNNSPYPPRPAPDMASPFTPPTPFTPQSPFIPSSTPSVVDSSLGEPLHPSGSNFSSFHPPSVQVATPFIPQLETPMGSQPSFIIGGSPQKFEQHAGASRQSIIQDGPNTPRNSHSPDTPSSFRLAHDQPAMPLLLLRDMLSNFGSVSTDSLSRENLDLLDLRISLGYNLADRPGPYQSPLGGSNSVSASTEENSMNRHSIGSAIDPHGIRIASPLPIMDAPRNSTNDVGIVLPTIPSGLNSHQSSVAPSNDVLEHSSSHLEQRLVGFTRHDSRESDLSYV